jgi:hypothetical protein
MSPTSTLMRSQCFPKAPGKVQNLGVRQPDRERCIMAFKSEISSWGGQGSSPEAIASLQLLAVGMRLLLWWRWVLVCTTISKPRLSTKNA